MKWWKEGKLTNKKNTFEDYIYAAKYLISKNYSSKGKLIPWEKYYYYSKDNKIIENKVALSQREFSNKKILFRLFNPKRNKSVSFNIYEKAKLSTNVELAYNNSYRLIDVRYDTSTDSHTINRKYVNLLVDLPQYLNKSKKSCLLYTSDAADE